MCITVILFVHFYCYYETCCELSAFKLTWCAQLSMFNIQHFVHKVRKGTDFGNFDGER